MIGKENRSNYSRAMNYSLTLFDLKGKTALVTGSSSGLGERFARCLSQAGARVIMAARTLEK